MEFEPMSIAAMRRASASRNADEIAATGEI
jgi:hypothetical protein